MQPVSQLVSKPALVALLLGAATPRRMVELGARAGCWSQVAHKSRLLNIQELCKWIVKVLVT